MTGIAPILDRIASIENRFTRTAPVPQQALGMSPERNGSTGSTGSSSATVGSTSTSAPRPTSGANYETRFDQALAAAEAALPGADFSGTGGLPPGLELVSADPTARATGNTPATTGSAATGSATTAGAWNATQNTMPAATWNTSANTNGYTTPGNTSSTTPYNSVGGSERVATTPVSPTWSTSGPASAVPAGTPFADEFARAGTAHDVPANLLAAVGWVESRYDVGALSPDGAIGVMQLMPGTAADLGVDPHDPTAAIDGAARLLRGHHDRFGSWDLALAAYFSGAGAVSRNGNQAPPRGAEYAQRVMQRMETS